MLDPPLWIVPTKALSLSLSVRARAGTGKSGRENNCSRLARQRGRVPSSECFLDFAGCSHKTTRLLVERLSLACYSLFHLDCVCVFITAVPIIKLFAWGERMVEDMCSERR